MNRLIFLLLFIVLPTIAAEKSYDQRTEFTKKFLAATQENNLDVMEDMLIKGADVNANCGSTFKDTALIYMINHQNIEGVKKLLNAGADVNKEDGIMLPLGHAAVMAAIIEDFSILDELLKSKNIKINMQHQKSGDTALMDAVDMSSLKGIIKLIKAGAKIDIRDKCHKTAIDRANKKDPEIKKLLIAYSDKKSSRLKAMSWFRLGKHDKNTFISTLPLDIVNMIHAVFKASDVAEIAQ